MPDGIWVRWAPGSGARPSRRAEEVSFSASGENSSSSYRVSRFLVDHGMLTAATISERHRGGDAAAAIFVTCRQTWGWAQPVMMAHCVEQAEGK